MPTERGARVLTVAAITALFLTLGAPVAARDVAIKIGTTAAAGIAPPGGTTIDAGLGAGIGAANVGGSGLDLNAGASDQGSASSNLQSGASTGSTMPGLDRLSIQGDSGANVNVFYKLLKTKF